MQWVIWTAVATVFWGLWGFCMGRAESAGTALGVTAGAVLVEAVALAWAWPQVKESFSWWMVGGGVAAAVAYAALMLALRTGGEIGPVFALTALYPAIAAILAWVVLDQQLSGRQVAGVGFAVIAGVLLVGG